MSSIDELIASLTETANALKHTLPEPEQLFTDATSWSAQTRYVETTIAGWRQDLERAALEATGSNRVVGQGWQIKSTPKYVWYVNLQRVVKDLGAVKGWTAAQTFGWLANTDALRLSWSIKALRSVFAAAGVGLLEQQTGTAELVEDLGGPHAVRVQTGETVSRERISEEGTT